MTRLLSFILFVLVSPSVSTAVECPLETDPVTILSCVAIDAVGLVEATKGNLRVFCTMAERFMECVKTKTRGCFGEEFVRGSLSELIDLSQKCCVNKGEKIGDECPFVNRPQCFSLTDMAQTSNGTLIPIGDLREGTKVLAMDSNDRIISTEIISILHYEKTNEALFYTFITETDEQISVTPDHLLYVGNQTYLPAYAIDRSKHFLYLFSSSSSSMTNDDAKKVRRTSIRSIDLEFRSGYSTPLTNEGTLLVNRISASCYSSIYNHRLGNFAMTPLRWIYRGKKLFFADRFSSTSDSEYEGFHWYPKLLNNALQMFSPHSISSHLTNIKTRL